jgi:hypothetical protein
MRTGGPFKPSFGLSGVVPPAGRVSPRLVRAFLQSSRIQSLPVLPHRVMAKTAPLPIIRELTQPTLHWIAMNRFRPQGTRSAYAQ